MPLLENTYELIIQCLSRERAKPLQYKPFLGVQSPSHVWLSVTPWTAAHQASLSFTISLSLLRLMSIESVMPSNNLILCHPLLLLPSVFLSIRVFSNRSALLIRWPKYWSFSFSISSSNEYSGLTGCISVLPKRLSGVFSNTTEEPGRLQSIGWQRYLVVCICQAQSTNLYLLPANPLVTINLLSTSVHSLYPFTRIWKYTIEGI